MAASVQATISPGCQASPHTPKVFLPAKGGSRSQVGGRGIRRPEARIVLMLRNHPPIDFSRDGLGLLVRQGLNTSYKLPHRLSTSADTPACWILASAGSRVCNKTFFFALADQRPPSSSAAPPCSAPTAWPGYSANPTTNALISSSQMNTGTNTIATARSPIPNSSTNPFNPSSTRECAK